MIKYFDPVSFKIKYNFQRIVHDAAAPTNGAIVKAPTDQFGVGQDTFDRGKFRISFNSRGGNPPTFFSTV